MLKLTQSEASALFSYDKETGIVTRKIAVNKGRGGAKFKAGAVVGALSSRGYLQVTVKGKKYQLHRLIWLLVEGYLPEVDIDHRNRVRTDNRWSNLRVISRQCNSKNCVVGRNNLSSVTGVGWQKSRGKWRAYIEINGRYMHLGISDDFVEAVAHRLSAEQCLEWVICDDNSSAFLHMRAYLCDSRHNPLSP